MADRHKHYPLTFRPPEADRVRLLAYVERTGTPLRKVLRLALAAYLDAASGDSAAVAETPPPRKRAAKPRVPAVPPREPVTSLADALRASLAAVEPGGARTERARAALAAGEAATGVKAAQCPPHPKARVLKGLCRACGRNVGDERVA